MSITSKSVTALGLMLGPLVAQHAFAEIYMSDSKAAATIFPGVAFERGKADISDDELRAIEKATGEKARSKAPVFFKGPNKEIVFIDQVLGKHEFITFAVGIKPNGEVAGIEILEYRESFGNQVTGQAWRAQFAGKTISAPLKLDADIRNISGATLSSAHVTGGVRRLLKTHEILRARI
jgi:Na+-translocating ferredoxin:NAD+ oxidoreductase RnfG subunit